jgi:hypothetical protein
LSCRILDTGCGKMHCNQPSIIDHSYLDVHIIYKPRRLLLSLQLFQCTWTWNFNFSMAGTI